MLSSHRLIAKSNNHFIVIPAIALENCEMVFKVFFLLTLSVLNFSCGTTQAKKIPGRNGTDAYLLECLQIEDCHAQAKRLCKDAYDTRISSWTPDSADRSKSRHSITIECKNLKKYAH